MSLHQYAQQAWLNIIAAKLRALLAVLGVLVGTAAVVALISCGQLATEKALAQFKALGTDLLAVTTMSKNRNNQSNDVDPLPLSFWRQLDQKVPSIKQLAPFSTIYQPISFQGQTVRGEIIGADDSLKEVLHLSLARGNFVSFVDSYEHYCVLGSQMAQQLHAIQFTDPIGQQVRLGHALYTIIGILKPEVENNFFNEDLNNGIIVPIAGVGLINTDSRINNAIIRLRADANLDTVMAQLTQRITEKAPTVSVYIRSPKQIIRSMESQGHTFTLLLAVIGSISLFVGGIGVMNVMLVSVSERKKEIGIRKAIGAKNSDIHALFLIESILLSLVGGTLGICLGVLLTWVIAYASDWPFSIQFLPSCAGFAVSVATGIFFGFYPAKRAALLEPIASLRGD